MTPGIGPGAPRTSKDTIYDARTVGDAVMTSLRIAVASMAVLGLASCASTDDRSGAYVPSEGSRSVVVSDDAYVARVEQIARRRGIDVQWVHIPTKRVARDDD